MSFFTLASSFFFGPVTLFRGLFGGLFADFFYGLFGGLLADFFYGLLLVDFMLISGMLDGWVFWDSLN